jgi:hypothetical protein
MLDLVKQETERIESRFLEPACGNGNFLIEVLSRKFSRISSRYSKSRLYNYFTTQYINHFGFFTNDDLPNTVKYIFNRNIVWGDALTLKTVGDNPKPIVFS